MFFFCYNIKTFQYSHSDAQPVVHTSCPCHLLATAGLGLFPGLGDNLAGLGCFFLVISSVFQGERFLSESSEGADSF